MTQTSDFNVWNAPADASIVMNRYSDTKSEKAILFDTARCTACKGCQVACKCWNNLPSEGGWYKDSLEWSGSYQNPADINGTTRLIVTYNETYAPETQKRVQWAFGRRACQHCTDAGCVSVCPAGAVYHDPTSGMVTHDQSKCIGCKACSSACAFDVPRYDTTIDGRTVINKCSGCVDRIANGMAPACVTTCQPEALQFGNREDMIAAANESVERLKARGFENACVYGVDEMDGLHVIQVLKYGVDAHGQVKNPTVPVTVPMTQFMKPLTGVITPVVVVGLAAMAVLATGYKRDILVYNEETQDTLNWETGEVVKHGDGQDERSVKEALTENLPFVKHDEEAATEGEEGTEEGDTNE